MNITILGLGIIGTANKLHFESRGHTVNTYDPPLGLTRLEKADLYVICTPSHVIEEVIRDIRLLDPEPVISIESTIIEFGLVERLARKTPYLCYCPQRYWADDPHKRGVVRYRLIASPAHQRYFILLYRDLGIETLPTLPIVAEYTKIAENAYRGLQIAFVQELKNETGVYFESIRHGIITASEMHYLPEARKGIGGECLPLAMDTLKHMPLIRQAIESNKRYMETEQ